MISNDTPISEPKDDAFGIDPFAKAIARAVERISVPEGTVLALTGPWGSGKSSAVNLVRFHLRAFEEGDLLKTIVFNPWWYADEKSLTRAFFQHLYSGLGKELSNKTRRLILSLGKRVLGSGPLISTAVLERIRKASTDGRIFEPRHFLSLLYRWREFASEKEVRSWTASRFSDDNFIIRMADAITSTVWVTSMGFDGMGDRVSQGVPAVQIEGLDSILDVGQFLERVGQLKEAKLSNSDLEILARFHEGMRRHEEEQNRRRIRNETEEPLKKNDKETE